MYDNFEQNDRSYEKVVKNIELLREFVDFTLPTIINDMPFRHYMFHTVMSFITSFEFVQYKPNIHDMFFVKYIQSHNYEKISYLEIHQSCNKHIEDYKIYLSDDNDEDVRLIKDITTFLYVKQYIPNSIKFILYRVQPTIKMLCYMIDVLANWGSSVLYLFVNNGLFHNLDNKDIVGLLKAYKDKTDNTFYYYNISDFIESHKKPLNREFIDFVVKEFNMDQFFVFNRLCHNGYQKDKSLYEYLLFEMDNGLYNKYHQVINFLRSIPHDFKDELDKKFTMLYSFSMIKI